MTTKKHREYLKRSSFNDNRFFSPSNYATLEELRLILGEPNLETPDDYVLSFEKTPPRISKF